MDQVLVTGANGFIGAHVTKALVKAGRKVRALVLPKSDMRNLEPVLDLIEVVPGDLRKASSLNHAVHGCQVIYHLAAYNNLWSRHASIPYEINVMGMRRLLAAAKKAGVQKIIYTSSATLFQSGNGRPANERDFCTKISKKQSYEYSKFHAEKELFSYLEDGIEIISLAPTAPIGPGDLNLTGPGRLIHDFLNQKLPAYLDTGINLVDVEEVARLHLVAEEKGQTGSRYILGGENMSIKDLLKTLEELTGIKAPTSKVPYFVALSAAYVSEGIANWITKKPPTAPIEGVKLARKPCYYDCAKAERELGLQKTNVRASLEKSVTWFKTNGFVGN